MIISPSPLTYFLAETKSTSTANEEGSGDCFVTSLFSTLRICL